MFHIRVRNFEQFQHYKHRNPPWIRIYYKLLHDPRFYRLDDATKWLAVGCFLLASQHENKIPFDCEWITKELCLSASPNWQALLDSEFIQPTDCDASALLATCKRDASQSRVDNSDSTEAEILSNSQKPANSSGAVSGGSDQPASETKPHGEKQRSAKESSREASEIFKHWNQQSATMHHRAIGGQEKAILLTLRKYDPAEIRRAIERYSQVRANESGRYRDLYQWTLGEFLTRKNHYNVERFNAENWEEPFLSKAFANPNGSGKQEYDWSKHDG